MKTATIGIILSLVSLCAGLISQAFAIRELNYKIEALHSRLDALELDN